MWKYVVRDAYTSISLHDCRADSITTNGNDLMIDFPDGFWITPGSSLVDCDRPVKTGSAQLCICGLYTDEPFDYVDVYKFVKKLVR